MSINAVMVPQQPKLPVPHGACQLGLNEVCLFAYTHLAITSRTFHRLHILATVCVLEKKFGEVFVGIAWGRW